jgi:molybdopterin converting factor small subunit
MSDSDRVRIELPRVLADHADGQRHLSIAFEPGDVVGSVLDRLGASYPLVGRRVCDETGSIRQFVNVYIDGEDVRRLAGRDTPVSPGQSVRIIQSVAGG